MTVSEAGRRYGGQDSQTRRAVRRERLIGAGLALFGTDGYQRVSVKQICDEAGLTQRYFYESFDDREALLSAVYEETIEEIADRTARAIAWGGATIADVTQVGLGEFIGYLTEDRRRARIMLIEIVGVSAALDERRTRVIHSFADLVVETGMAHAGRTDPVPGYHLAAVGLVGAVNQLLVDWTLGHADTDPDRIAEVCTRLFSATFADFVRD